jgi:hypothetical protein
MREPNPLRQKKQLYILNHVEELIRVLQYFLFVLLCKVKVEREENPTQHATHVLRVAENELLNYMDSILNRQRGIRSIKSATTTQAK